MWKIENFQRTTTSTTKHQIRIYTHIYIISFISITGIKKMEILLIKSKKINFCITCSKRGRTWKGRSGTLPMLWIIGGVPVVIRIHLLPIEFSMVRRQMFIILCPIISLMMSILHIIATIHNFKCFVQRNFCSKII